MISKPFHNTLKDEGGNREDQQPSVLTKKADHLAGCAKNKADNLAKEARQNVGNFFAKRFKAVSYTVGNPFQATSERAENNTDGCSDCKQSGRIF